VFGKDPAKEAKKLGLTLPLYEELQAELERRKRLPKPKTYLVPAMHEKPAPKPLLNESDLIQTYLALLGLPGVIVRQYRQMFKGHDEATRRFAEEAQILAAHGYVPTSQSWQAAGMFSQSDGFLTVSYARQDLQRTAS
jgi:hypothetical protein